MPSLLLHVNSDKALGLYCNNVKQTTISRHEPYSDTREPSSIKQDTLEEKPHETDTTVLSFLSVLYDFVFSTQLPQLSPVLRTGLLPTTPSKAIVETSPLEITVPIVFGKPVHHVEEEEEEDQTCPSLSTSNSSTLSWSSTEMTEDSDLDMFQDSQTQTQPPDVFYTYNENTAKDSCPSNRATPLQFDLHVIPQPMYKEREMRVNSACWRMLASEIDMMYANKIICPLRPRGFLQKRQDPFVIRPSPLSQEIL